MVRLTRINFVGGDDEEALIDENDKTILSGDDYHDKIVGSIYGFLCGLKYAGVVYEVTEREMDGSLYDSKYC